MYKHCEDCGADVLAQLYRQHREAVHARASLRNGRGATTEQKRKIKQRQGNVCFGCGLLAPASQLEVHHRNGDWRDNRMLNLVALCPPCHAAADAEVRAAQQQQSMTRS